MTLTRVYDLPTRIFHWLFAACFIFAFGIANIVDDEDDLFAYHMIAGLVMFILSDFKLHPAVLITYLKQIFAPGGSTLWRGHNPASSWAAVTMLITALVLGITGVLMTRGAGGEALEELHEIAANVFLIVVVLHLSGIIIHTLKHRDALAKSMVTGNKAQLQAETPLVASRTTVGVVLLAAVIGFTVYLLNNFDKNSRRLAVFGTELYLAEDEYENNRQYPVSRKREHHDDGHEDHHNNDEHSE